MSTSIANSLSDFSRDLVLRDGAMLRFRALRPGDRDALKALLNRCSPSSIRYRFLHSIKSLPEKTLDQMAYVEGSRVVALVVIQGGGADERIIAVGQYHALEDRPDVAEVSFLVEDAMQRRGIGTLLLDLLAEVAHGHGVNRFSADVLADNHVMLSVFRKAGYALSSAVSYGVTHLEFPIAYSEVAESRAEAQEAEAERASLRPVLAPQSIAVIGASRDPQSVGGALFRNLIRWGFAGAVYPVNPRASAVAGVHAYASVADLPEVPELVFIIVPASAVLDAARQCAALSVRALCVISAGFAETGAEGAAAQAELLDLCRAHGMRLVGPNCLGLVNTSSDVRMLGAFTPMDPPAGNIAISSQSGALGIALVNRARQLGLGISSFASIGNRADVSGNDLLQYWESDDATDVILLYLEGFGNPRRFSRIARRVSRRKPVVAVKSGRTAGGARAASSHTAALASSDRAASALFAQTGIIRVDTLAEFFAVARLLATQPIPAGNKIGILTNAGGPAIMAVDAAEAAGLEIPKLSEATQARLRAALPRAASVTNPVDMIASAGPAEYRACLEAMLDEPGLDALLIIFIPPLATPSTEVAGVLGETLANHAPFRGPIAAVFPDAKSDLVTIPAGERVVPAYDFPEGAVAALKAAARYGVWRATPAGHRVLIDIDRDTLDRVLAENRAGWLSQTDVARLLGVAGIAVAPSRLAHSPEEAVAAATTFVRPVAIKVAEPAILHKSDVGGVLLNIEPDKAATAYTRLAERLSSHGIALAAASVTPMAPRGVEVIAGITNDPVFGPLVAFGSGGALVELLDDVVFRVLPMTDLDAATMIRETRVYRLLQGFRGSAPSDVAALERLLLALGALAEAAPRIAEVDLNPVIVHQEGVGVSLIDARVRLSE
ncbi:MAG TPA: bifunctional GNAT family N-acetyltransferase/acetate--CoA ligase family protein [Blastocatellia bacterium]|jgi:acetyl coenzyme A synthetase (ADP forming)-like protein|nr:bifunctional GNAT family N-acetyltransferase/acetate--CoA ligase family protein [Blastocatellia bacterium]